MYVKDFQSFIFFEINWFSFLMIFFINIVSAWFERWECNFKRYNFVVTIYWLPT